MTTTSYKDIHHPQMLKCQNLMSKILMFKMKCQNFKN